MTRDGVHINLVKFGRMDSDAACGQTDRQTDILIAVLRTVRNDSNKIFIQRCMASRYRSATGETAVNRKLVRVTCA